MPRVVQWSVKYMRDHETLSESEKKKQCSPPFGYLRGEGKQEDGSLNQTCKKSNHHGSNHRDPVSFIEEDIRVFHKCPSEIVESPSDGTEDKAN
uniref:Uncharacterized protein n=1 Tax=viral metagenome TaxID=1070528 RepID=A0A6M3MFV5_9ZZZZ